MNALEKFFGVVAKSQTYLNFVYLLLAFPLGLFYFVFLVTGLSLGLGTIILWIGLALLVAMFAAWYGLTAFERQLAVWLLRADIPSMQPRDLTSLSVWQQFVAALKNPVTWKGLAYLLLKLPVGIFCFTVLVTLVSLSGALILAPFYYNWSFPTWDLSIGIYSYNMVWVIDTLGEALLISLAGVLIGFISLHVFNGLAWLSASFARVMLGNFSSAPVAPETILAVEA